MKKTIRYFLAILMVLSFTQCNFKNKDNKGEAESTETTLNNTQKQIEASPEFLNNKASLVEMIAVLRDGYDCDTIDKKLKAISDKYAGVTYQENEKIRDDEKEEIMKLYNEFATVAEEKAKELGCK